MFAPEAGAQCVSCARWDLRGGPPVRAVPTAIPTGRRGILAATEMYPRIQAVQAALTAAIGRDHPLTAIARTATVIVNEAKFQRQGANVRENAVTATVAAAGRALELGLFRPDVRAISAWDPLADDVLTFEEALSGYAEHSASS
jgi:hypothetical protein